MVINSQIWNELSSIVEAAYCTGKVKLPNEIDLDWYKTNCYIQCGYLVGKYKQCSVPLKAYIAKYLEKLAVDQTWEDYKKAKYELSHLEDIDQTSEEQHSYGYWNYDPQKSLEAHLQDKDECEAILKIAKANRLDKIARMLMTMSEREIADELQISQVAVHKKVQHLKDLVNNQLTKENK